MNEALKKLAQKNLSLMIYGVNSILVTILDVFIYWMLLRYTGISIVGANTAGVVSGFIVHYALSSKAVFKTNYSSRGFIVYLLTFLLGLALADWLIYASYHYLFIYLGPNGRQLASKAVSIVLPFFALYYLRKYIYDKMNSKSEQTKRTNFTDDNQI